MVILAIETAADGCSAAVSFGARIVASRFKKMHRDQSEFLFPMISEVLSEARIKYKEVDVVAVTRGPGSFTGVRVGLAAAHGIGLARNIPIFASTTLEIVAFKALVKERPKLPIISILNTKNEKFYLQIFSAECVALCSPQLLVLGKISEIIQKLGLSKNKIFLVGDRHPKIIERLIQSGCDCVESLGQGFPDAYWLACLASNKIKTHGLDELKSFPEPFYLQPLEARPAKNGGQLRPH